jgi:hypothetical protein
MNQVKYVGLDVHKVSISIAILDTEPEIAIGEKSQIEHWFKKLCS